MPGVATNAHRRTDGAVAAISRVAGSIAAGITFLIVAFLVLESLPALRAVGPLRFLTDPSWNPVHGAYNVAPMLLGTLVVTAGAVLLAAPLAVASAVFGRFYVRGLLS